MTIGTDGTAPAPAWLMLLREELAVRPGRLAAVARMATSCALIVAAAMIYQIPLPAYAAYVVLLVSREEATSTFVTGVVAAIAATLAEAFALLLYTLDASEPALRIPLMAGSAFLAMYLSRIITLGPVAFLAGYILVMSQTIIDEIPNLEALTRLVLWLWVVVVLPDTVTVLANLVTGEKPATLARRKALALLATLSRGLESEPPPSLARQNLEVLGLLKLRHLAGVLDRGLRRQAAVDSVLMEALAELFTLHKLLPAGIPGEVRLSLVQGCESCRRAYEANKPPMMVPPYVTEAMLDGLSPTARPVVAAVAAALARLSDGLTARLTAADVPKATAKSLFVADAFTNPAYPRFALKATLAVMASYVIYSGLDWPGISTAVTTCFFVALGTLGETMHKLTLRIGGAVIGGLAGGLCIVYLLPQMTDIGQLCLLIALVSAVSGWVATSSERLSYAGLQMAFAFFLGVLQGYGPATDLTVLRDRVVGILLGNLLMSVVFSTVWPESARDQARAALADALRALGRLVASANLPPGGARIAVIRALGEAHRLMAIAGFELRLIAAGPGAMAAETMSFDTLDRLAAAVFVVAGQETGDEITAQVHPQDLAFAERFEVAAAELSAPATLAAMDPVFIPAAPVPASHRAALEARVLLQSEIRNAHAQPT